MSIHGNVRIVNTSGNVLDIDTSGLIGINAGSLTANVSGDVVNISGQPVTVSGQVVNVASGARVVIMNAAGTVPTITALSLDNNSTALNGLAVAGFGYGFREGLSTSGWARLRVTESGQGMSGLNYKLAVDFSGAVCTASGDTYQVRTSGGAPIIPVAVVNSGGTQAVIVSPNTDALSQNQNVLLVENTNMGYNEMSGVWARLRVTQSGGGTSGIGHKLIVDFSGAIASVSGNAVNNAANTVTAPSWLTITGNSGGTTLTSQACTMVRIMNLSGNGTMLVGGTGTAAPVSGTKGIPLWPASLNNNTSEMDFPVTNANLIAVVAHTSGNQLSYMTFG